MSLTFARRKCEQNEYVMNDVIAVIAATDRTLEIFIFSASAQARLQSVFLTLLASFKTFGILIRSQTKL